MYEFEPGKREEELAKKGGVLFTNLDPETQREVMDRLEELPGRLQGPSYEALEEYFRQQQADNN